MGMYDEFIDIENRKSSQSKAFGSNLFYYFVGETVELNELFEKNKLIEPAKTLRIYADTNLPFEFIEIEYMGVVNKGETPIYLGKFVGFTEIKDVDYRTLVSPFTLYVDYWGRGKTIAEDVYYNYERMLRLWHFFIENVHLSDRKMHSIPYLYYDRYKENHECDKCNEKRLRYLKDRWDYQRNAETKKHLNQLVEGLEKVESAVK